jgi:hypothetical protein
VRIGHAASSESCESSLLFADVFVPHRWMRRNVARKHFDAFLRTKINHFDPVSAQPIDSTTKIHRFADDHRPDAKLPYKPAAVPARRQRRDHDLVVITALSPGFAKRIGLAMDRGVVFLNATIVPPAQQLATLIEKRCPDWNSSFGETLPRFVDGNAQHLGIAVEGDMVGRIHLVSAESIPIVGPSFLGFHGRKPHYVWPGPQLRTLQY